MTRAQKKLIDYMRKTQSTAADIARLVGIHRSAVGRWLAGERIPRQEEQKIINRLAKIINEWIE